MFSQNDSLSSSIRQMKFIIPYNRPDIPDSKYYVKSYNTKDSIVELTMDGINSRFVKLNDIFRTYLPISEINNPYILSLWSNKSYNDSIAIKRIEDRDKKILIERRVKLYNKYGKYYGNLIFKNNIIIGMTKSMVRESWGEPEDINRTVTSYSTHEQWVYGSTYVYFDNGKLTAWQD